jgi:hypothetical protein
MAGLIESKQAEAAPAAEAPAANAPGAAATSPQAIMENLHLQPGQREPLERIVAAGKKVLYSEQTHATVMERLNGKEPLPQTIGSGVAGILTMLVSEAQGALPNELLVPAGLVLVAEAADFLRQTGQQVSDADIGNAIQVMVGEILRAAGADPDKVAAIGEKGLQGGAVPGAPAGPAEAPQEAV